MVFPNLCKEYLNLTTFKTTQLVQAAPIS